MLQSPLNFPFHFNTRTFMHISSHAARLSMGVAAGLCFTACSDQVTGTAPQLQAPSLAAASHDFSENGFRFSALSSSFACTVSGGDPVNPLSLASGLTQTIIASEPQFADAIDMNTQNENGPEAGRYLYRPSEGAISEVTVTDLKNLGPNSTKRFAFRADWESFDPSVWTPWGTLLVGEETNAASKPDPDYPSAKAGLVYELIPNRNDPSVLDRIVARPAIGSKAHEGMRFDKAGNLIVISYAGKGTVYSFRPDAADDDLKLLEAFPSEARTGMTAVLPVDYWRNENDFEETILKPKPYQFVSPDGTTFFPAGEDFVSGELYYGSKLNDTLRAFGLARVTEPQKFYVSDESGQKTYIASVDSTGTITTVKLFLERGGESVAIDEKGNVYLAAGQVEVYSPKGDLIDTLTVPERPSQILFGGKDGHTLYVLARSSLYAVQSINTGR
jgi:hypothetical protein